MQGRFLRWEKVSCLESFMGVALSVLESDPSEIHVSYYTSPAFVSRSLACSMPSDLVVLLSS